MRICMKCYKNIKKEPASMIGKKGKTHYLICNDCLKTESIQGLIERNDWEVILNTPTLAKELSSKTK